MENNVKGPDYKEILALIRDFLWFSQGPIDVNKKTERITQNSEMGLQNRN